MTKESAKVEPQPLRQLDALRDFIREVNEWVAKFPLKGEASEPDQEASTLIYAYCEGAEENLYEIRQFLEAGVAAVPPTPTEPITLLRQARASVSQGVAAPSKEKP